MAPAVQADGHGSARVTFLHHVFSPSPPPPPDSLAPLLSGLLSHSPIIAFSGLLSLRVFSPPPLSPHSPPPASPVSPPILLSSSSPVSSPLYTGCRCPVLPFSCPHSPFSGLLSGPLSLVHSPALTGLHSLSLFLDLSLLFWLEASICAAALFGQFPISQ